MTRRLRWLRPSRRSPRLRQLLALDGAFFGRPRASADELEILRRVLAEGSRAAQSLNLAAAMFIAVDNAPVSETAVLIGHILNDRSAPQALRLHAAHCLGDIDARASSKALVEALVGAPPALEFALLKALAKVGDEEAGRAFAGRTTGPASLRRLRDVTRGLIALRRGVAPDSRADAALMPPGEDLPLTALTAADVKSLISGFRGSTYGIVINPSLAFEWSCQGERGFLLLSDQLEQGRLVTSVTASRRIAGLIASPDERGSKTVLARRVVVTRPERDGNVSISVLGPGGDIESTGMLRPQDKGLQLLLHSHPGAHRPFEVQGRVDEDRMVLRVRLFASGGAHKLGGDVDPAAA